MWNTDTELIIRYWCAGEWCCPDGVETCNAPATCPTGWAACPDGAFCAPVGAPCCPGTTFYCNPGCVLVIARVVR
jgi:hypothetical protein